MLATGGCAFFERILGGTGLTGDGLLMAAEAGASLSGMEFTGKYTLAPHDTSLNKGLPFRWATFYDASGAPLCDAAGEPVANGIGPAEKDVARSLSRGRSMPGSTWPSRRCRRGCARVSRTASCPTTVSASIRSATSSASRSAPRARCAAPAASASPARNARPRCRASTPPATRPPARTWRARPRAAARSTRPGRCRAAGGPAGAPPASHAGAARPAAFRAVSRRLGTAGLRPTERPRAIDPREVVAAVRDEVIPLGKNYFRDGAQLAASRERIETDLARGAGASRRRGPRAASRPRGRPRSPPPPAGRSPPRSPAPRAAACTGALDLPGRDDALGLSLLVGGLDEVTIRPAGAAADREERAS